MTEPTPSTSNRAPNRAPILALVLGLALTGCAPTASTAGEAPDIRPTIFTQVHDERVQSIAAGNRFEVQLPGDPAIWRREPRSESPNLEFLGQRRFESPGRIADTKDIQSFEYRITAPGPVTLTLTSDPPAPLPEDGRFSLLLQAD